MSVFFLPCSKDYLKDCSSIVSRTPSKSRYEVLWNDKAKKHFKRLDSDADAARLQI